MRRARAVLVLAALSALALAGDNYVSIGVILGNRGDVVTQVRECLKKAGVKDVSIDVKSPNPAIHVLKKQAETARKALKKAGLRVLIYERNKK